MRIVDEYVALRVVVGDWPSEIDQDLLGLTYTRHWRLLSAMAVPGGGRISRQLSTLSSEDREAIRRPHPDLVEVLDPRATSLLAAELLESIGPTSVHRRDPRSCHPPSLGGLLRRRARTR